MKDYIFRITFNDLCKMQLPVIVYYCVNGLHQTIRGTISSSSLYDIEIMNSYGEFIIILNTTIKRINVNIESIFTQCFKRKHDALVWLNKNIGNLILSEKVDNKKLKLLTNLLINYEHSDLF